MWKIQAGREFFSHGLDRQAMNESNLVCSRGPNASPELVGALFVSDGAEKSKRLRSTERRHSLIAAASCFPSRAVLRYARPT